MITTLASRQLVKLNGVRPENNISLQNLNEVRRVLVAVSQAAKDQAPINL